MRVELNNIQLEYEDAGEGVPVVLLHGFPFDRYLWADQAEVLQEHSRIITPDLRGFGDSSAPEEVYTMEQYAADVIGLLDLLEIERAIIGGLSMGGYIALAIAEAFPERMMGLILSNTHPSKDTFAQRQKRINIAEKTNYDGTEFLVEDMLEKVLCKKTLDEKPAVVEYVQQMMRRQPASGIRGAMRGMADRKDRNHILTEIMVPTLVIASKDDVLIPLIDCENMERELPHGYLEIIADAGHLPNLEQPEIYNEMLLKMIESFAVEKV